MYFWKLDEETIRCLINKDEIDQMGFDVEYIGQNDDAMNDFLNAIIEDSLNYVSWNPEHGVQNYVARSLPADQFLLTISCTFPEDAINRDLKQIGKMTQALKKTITEERINEIFNMDGEEKEKAFEALTRDLHNVCNGNIDQLDSIKDKEDRPEAPGKTNDDSTKKTVGKKLSVRVTDQVITFFDFSALIAFANAIPGKMHYPSDLYKLEDAYKLVIRMGEAKEEEVVSFSLLTEEYGGRATTLAYEEAYLKEHGKLLMIEDALSKLHKF